MSLLLLFHPRVLAATVATGDISFIGTSTFSIEGSAQATGAAFAQGVGDAQAVGASLTATDFSMAGIGGLQAEGAALVAGDVFTVGTGDLLAEGAGGAVIVPPVVITIPGDGGMASNPWQERKRRKDVTLDRDLEDLTAFAVMAAAQISRDYVARCRR